MSTKVEISHARQWLRAGDEIFPALLAALDAAQQSICLEIYIFASGPPGDSFRAALIRARERGVRVRVLVDAFGSLLLNTDYWTPLRQAGGEVRLFNPVNLKRFSIRNHRKLLVCDSQTAFIGGFNIAPEYEGDGVRRGWLDLGLKIEGGVAARLEASFEEMFARADFEHKRFARLRKSTAKKAEAAANEQLLFSGPGRGPSPFHQALTNDLAQAREVRMVMAYFVPPRRLVRSLVRVVRRGGRVQLLLAGRSDVPLAQLAAQSLYRRLLKAGIEVYEYQPQILHAKLIIVDEVVYAGSSNLDPRGLHINYELMIRFSRPPMAAGARGWFAGNLAHARQVTGPEWNRACAFWGTLKRRWARFLLSRIDPWLALRQWRSLPE